MFRITTIVMVVCLSAMVAQGQNLFTNGDFETGDLTAYNTDLQAGGVSFGVVPGSVPGKGGNHLYHFDTGINTIPHYGNLHQGGQPGHQPKIPLPNSNPHFSADVFANTDAVGPSQAAPQLQFYNGAGDWVGLVYWGFGGGPTSWGTGIHNHAGAQLAVIQINKASSNGAWTHIDADIPAMYESYFPMSSGVGDRWAGMGVESVWFTFQTWAAENTTSKVSGWADNFVLTDVPEPATMSLLALGAIGMLRRKRS